MTYITHRSQTVEYHDHFRQRGATLAISLVAGAVINSGDNASMPQHI